MILTGKLLGECSPYIFNLVYDIDVRMLFIECVDTIKQTKPNIRIVFPEIISYSEKNLQKQPDDEYMDDLVVVERTDDNHIKIITYKKEIELELSAEPFTESV
ncbi:MAG: hypothetical protein OEY36_03935 [Gammaproteobacteria bacterium]|nr:hypothetical protein [Gammaproteobacteria bacterium]